MTGVNRGNRLRWYMKRLRTMSIPELGHRAQELIKKKQDYYFKKNFLPNGKIGNYPKPILHLPEITTEVQSGEYSIFGNVLVVDDSINWHMDIMNDKEFPMDFSFDIDTRTGKHGNVKVVWEINRLQFLTSVCLAYHQSKDPKYLKRFMNIIVSWKKANPYLKGVNWYSNIEVSIRIINWFLCWEILQVDKLVHENEGFMQFTDNIWLPLIELHGHHAARYESKYSSSNNHTIAEASGMFILGSYWSFKKSPHWLQKGKSRLEKEILKQHSSNGINKEEASEYIQFITDFFMITYIVGNRTGEKFSFGYRQMLKNIFSYIYHLMDISGRVPYYGDDDDGKVFSLNIDPSNDNFKSLLASGAVIFNEPMFKAKGTIFDLKNRILFGREKEKKFNDLSNEEVVVQTKLYKDEGHFFIKKGDSKNEIYLHIDIAPLGYLSIAAHGHADALSFFLTIDGKPYIIDPGTYTYHSYPEWREYFKGTLAHNTIRVDGLNQSTNAGPCLWVDHYSSKLLNVQDDQNKIEIKGGHNGYENIGVQHIRSYTFDKEKDRIVVIDEIVVENDSPHYYELPFHLHPTIEVMQFSPQGFEIYYPGERVVKIEMDEKLNSKVVTGSKEPLLGWYSPSFLKKEATSVIYNTIETSGSFTLKTELWVKSNEEPS